MDGITEIFLKGEPYEKRIKIYNYWSRPP